MSQDWKVRFAWLASVGFWNMEYINHICDSSKIRVYITFLRNVHFENLRIFLNHRMFRRYSYRSWWDNAGRIGCISLIFIFQWSRPRGEICRDLHCVDTLYEGVYRLYLPLERDFGPLGEDVSHYDKWIVKPAWKCIYETDHSLVPVWSRHGPGMVTTWVDGRFLIRLGRFRSTTKNPRALGKVRQRNQFIPFPLSVSSTYFEFFSLTFSSGPSCYFRNGWLIGEPISWTRGWFAWDFAKWLSWGLNFQRVFGHFLSFTTEFCWAVFCLSCCD
jgi:hypothetical protein